MGVILPTLGNMLTINVLKGLRRLSQCEHDTMRAPNIGIIITLEVVYFSRVLNKVLRFYFPI